MYVAVGAFGHTSPGAVKDCLGAACFLCFLRCHHGGDQIERLDITVEKARVLCCHQLNRRMSIGNLSGSERDPEITRTLRESMFPGPGSPRHLIIDKQAAGIHLFYKTVQKLFQFFLADGHDDLQSMGISKKAVHVFIQRKNMIIPAGTGIIHPVPEPGSAVVHGDRHLIQRTIVSVIISKFFHM